MVIALNALDLTAYETFVEVLNIFFAFLCNFLIFSSRKVNLCGIQSILLTKLKQCFTSRNTVWKHSFPHFLSIWNCPTPGGTRDACPTSAQFFFYAVFGDYLNQILQKSKRLQGLNWGHLMVNSDDWPIRPYSLLCLSLPLISSFMHLHLPRICQTNSLS